jgi:ferredoxin
VIRLTADRERCVGAGQCVLTEDTVFAQDEVDGRVRLRTETPDAELVEALRFAVTICPAHALELWED